MSTQSTRGASAYEPLDRKTREEWLKLSAHAALANAGTSPCRANEALDAAARSEPQSPLAPAYRLWIADNLAREARYLEAVKAFDSAIQSAQSAPRFLVDVDPTWCSLRHKAQAAAAGGDLSLAVATYRELAKVPSEAADALFQAGLIAEASRDDQQAVELYASVARKCPSSDTDDPAELARRAQERLVDPTTVYFSSPWVLVELLVRALEGKHTDQLDLAISRTHFAAGAIGGHTAFDQPELLEQLYQDLQDSSVSAQRKVAGSGDKLYLTTSGWEGDWFRGDVGFLLTRAPKGWQWTGVGVSEPHEMWQERWRPATRQANQSLPFSLLAPWPAGVSFMAGGLGDFVAKQLAIVAAGPILGGLLAAAFARNACGFGPRGFYYNQGSTHDEEDAFAIDFTRYRTNVPYDPESEGTPVLAPRAGIVARVNAGVSSGSSSASNTVEITHQDPGNPSDTTRFRSRYLHLAGPFQITVSEMMPVITGQRLGLMDDTGNSWLHHLHFSIHDRNLPHPDASFGRSVRPTPMSGVSLGDGASARCVRSTNSERSPGLNFSPKAISFGSVPVGDIRTRTLTIENTSGSSVTVSFPGSTSGAFRWQAFNQTMPDSEKRTVVFEFRPAGQGIAQRTVTISSEAPGNPHTIKLTGKGLEGVEPL